MKTLQDRPRLLPTRSTTVHFLVTCRPSSYLPDTRLPFERHVSTLTAAAVLVRFEVDHDLHVVLRAAGETMIAEAPNSACTAAGVAPNAIELHPILAFRCLT